MVKSKFDLLTTQQNALYATAGLGIIYVLLKHRHSLLKRLRSIFTFRNPLSHLHIELIETPEDCNRVIETLRKHCETYKVLGIDCEWVQRNSKRSPVALLQLASHEGLCALFRLCSIQHIPRSLRVLLEDEEIMKVGVAAMDDANKIANDYGVCIASTLDLRYVATLAHYKPMGLEKLSFKVLNMRLNKKVDIACSNWEAKNLNQNQQKYAASDALVAVEIFKKLQSKLQPRPFWQFKKGNFNEFKDQLLPFIDLPFKQSYAPRDINTSSLDSVRKKKPTAYAQRKLQTRSYSTTRTHLYDNCLLQAPDGELLCTIHKKKAQWYVHKNLGTEISQEPYTVRLNFEPAGRAVGEVGCFYKLPKENKCVVCGETSGIVRKNVIPREYRKHFPELLKSHTSHDIVPLCVHCHQISNISDSTVRTRLAKKCDAPLVQKDSDSKLKNLHVVKKLKLASRALLNYGDTIPEQRRNILKQIVLEHYPDESEVTPDLLMSIMDLDSTLLNVNMETHGKIVVKQFQEKFGGLVTFEKMWREHFLKTMKPKFLPELWNVEHNAARLEIRVSEGRMNEEEMVLVGLRDTTSNDTTNHVNESTANQPDYLTDNESDIEEGHT